MGEGGAKGDRPLKGRLWPPSQPIDLVVKTRPSEERRLALLPRGPALAWDDLMVQPDYMHALGLLP